MDTNHLRSLTLAKLLSSSYGSGSSNCGVEVAAETSKPLKINKQNVQNLVDGFWKLNQNEKLMFLVGVQQQQQGGGSGQNNNQRVVGSTPPPLPPVTNGDLATPTPPTTTPTLPTTAPPTPTITTPPTHPSPSRLSTTTTWLLTNFTSDPLTALPKEEVYDFYTQTFPSKPISTADFGKLMRQVFPDVRARRLGQRGASKYCYANIRKKSPNDVDKPTLTEIKISLHDDYLNWAKLNFSMEFDNLETLLYYLKCNNFKNPRKRRNSSVSMVTKKIKSEDLEISKYFKEEDSWPHLRNLLDNKKRHCSNNVVMTTSKTNDFDTFRSASVPIFEPSSSSRYVLSSSRSADSGYDSVHSNTPLLGGVGAQSSGDFGRDEFLGGNPLLSSVLMEGGTTGGSGCGDSGDDDGGGVLFDSVFDLIVDERGELMEMERSELISGGGDSGGGVGGGVNGGVSGVGVNVGGEGGEYFDVI